MDAAVIREAKGKDCEEIMQMIKDLARFEKMESSVKIDAGRLKTDLENGKFNCFVCQNVEENIIVGYAMFVYTFDMKHGKKIYLEDLFIKEKFRSQGLGSKMWNALTAKGKEKGCSYLEFSVLNWNKDAIEFYNNRGCENHTLSENRQVFRFLTNNNI